MADWYILFFNFYAITRYNLHNAPLLSFFRFFLPLYIGHYLFSTSVTYSNRTIGRVPQMSSPQLLLHSKSSPFFRTCFRYFVHQTRWYCKEYPYPLPYESVFSLILNIFSSLSILYHMLFHKANICSVFCQKNWHT